MSATRRLAAIMVVDVVGYSRHMEADESWTLAALKQRRITILEPVVKEHGGRIVKLMGDGALIEFASAVKAAEAALELQRRMGAANDSVTTERRIVLRIGINLGDVVGEGSDIFGEGVNIAARLEALAEPGGICLSAKIYEEVRGKIDVKFVDIGDQALKNIAAPVRAFRWSMSELEPPLVHLDQSFPGIVLPFANLSGDPEQQYFSDGISEDIITELSRFRSLAVIARNSSFQYRDRAVDVRRISRELGARYVVEGSVRRMGGRIRITAQLIDASSGNHLWSERFDRSIEQLFEVQDEVTQTIVATLAGRLEDTELRSAVTRKTNNPAAYDCFLRGFAELRSFEPGENRRARELFQQAITLDPNFALGHSYTAMALLAEYGYDSAPREVKERALDLALTGVRLDRREGRCQLTLGWTYRYLSRFDLAVSHAEQGLKLNPNDANGLAQFAVLLAVVGRAEEGVDYTRRAMRLNPHHPEWYWGTLSNVMFHSRRYEEALQASSNIGKGKKAWTLAREAACLAQLGRMHEAHAVTSEILRIKPSFRISTEMPSFKRDEEARHLHDALAKAGLPE